MGIGDQLPVDSGQRQQLAHDVDMPLRRLRNPRAVAGEPVAYLTPCLSDRFGSREYARRGDEAQEREEARPRQTDIGGSAELPVEPVPGIAMLTESAHMGVDQDIGVDEDHLKDSPSAIASASLMLSSGICAGPRSTTRVRNGSRGFVRAVMSLIPRLSASLIRSLRLLSRALRRRSRLAATSSSMVRVVLTHQNITMLMS